MRPLTLYYRHGCHLCDDLEEELAARAPHLLQALQRVDVDTRPELAARYGDRVPVLAGEGGDICHHFLDWEQLARYLDGR